MKQLFVLLKIARLRRIFIQKFVSGLVLFAMLAGQIVSLPVVSAAVANAAVAEAAVIETANASVADAAVANAAVAEAAVIETASAANAPAKAGLPNGPNIVYDLVVLVVDMDLDKDNSSYDGLKADYPEFVNKLSANKLGNRILRYAEDIRSNNELTDVKILFYDKQKDDVLSLANALENLYRNGDGDNKNRLTGVVLIGDIPLPVVNKKGNRYISLFPYTDFSDKAYIFNEKTKSFEKNELVSFPKPEIWHGVMKAPSNDAQGRQKLAEFLDKNHLYYEGEPMFAKFDRKMFFGDLVHEEESVNPDVYKQYVDYLASLEDLAYFRYNKFWAAELTSKTMKALQEIPEDIKVKGGFADSIQNTNPLATLPDIYSKSIIDQNLLPYYQVLSKYIGKANDWSDYTARYVKSKTDGLRMDSVAGLIAIKDEYTKFYLKNVNDALEKKVNQVIEKIQEPIDLLDYSVISGEIGDIDFEVNASTIGQLFVPGDAISYRFHYRNEEDGKMYLNGVAADVVNSPKQCMPLLGSTKSEYFDEESLDFNPKAVDGEYSILTRSIRSDNINTAMGVHTTGVNTRLLSPISIGGQPSELFIATNQAYAGSANSDGSYDTGAVIEDRPEYGISAFIHNPLYPQTDPDPNNSSYKGPLAEELQKGDVITKVNGKNISFSNTFDQAIEESYATVRAVIEAVNKKKLDQLKDFPYQIKIIPGESLGQADIATAVGYFSVEFYRNGAPMTKYFSFTVDKKGLTNKMDPGGNPEMYVLFDTPPNVNFDLPATFEAKSQGAIFTLYDGQKQGYNGRPYDGSAGCNANSTSQNGDRCFGMIAAVPVFDVVGSLAPVKMNIPGDSVRLKFPEKVKRNTQGVNSGNAADYTKHVDSYQFPGGGQNDRYKYEDIDSVYFDACYSGLPSVVETAFTPDSNPYSFPLDDSTDLKPAPPIDSNIGIDYYGRLLDSFGKFAASGLSNDPDYEEGDSPADSSSYNPKESIWLNLDKIDAGQIILNEDPKVTLKDFSDRYGLFDGKDNDGDNLIDYEWRDEDKDGVYETKYYDFDEANPQYAIPSWNVNEIARKLLSHDSIYTIPYSVGLFPYDNFDSNISLHVKPHSYKQISSTILHNEPTEFTISEQLKSQTAFSLPIDNPRYVALQTVPKPGPVYPDPKPVNAFVNVQEILDKLKNTNAHYSPGSIKKVNYVNLFAPEIKNMAQMQAALTSKANEIATLSGSYRIFGPDAKDGEYTPKQISDEILNNYLLPVVNNDLDDPIQGFSLIKASEPKIYDAFKWLFLNIDEKHEYVLRSYLNGDATNQGNAYVNDSTLLPAPIGYEPGYGYEAAYLVLNGDKDNFDLNFNKDLPPENDGQFDPLSQILTGGEENGGVGGGGGDGDGGGGEEEDSSEYQFVWITDFLGEIQRFVDSIKVESKPVNVCSNFFDYFSDGDKEAEAGVDAAAGGEEKPDEPPVVPDPNANEVQLNSYVYSEITGFDELTAAISEQEEKAEQDKKTAEETKKKETSGDTGTAGGETGGDTSTDEQGGDGGAATESKNIKKTKKTPEKNPAGTKDDKTSKELKGILSDISKESAEKESAESGAIKTGEGAKTVETGGQANSQNGAGTGATGAESAAGVGDKVVDEGGGEKATSESDKDLQILKSKPVEKITLESTLVEEEEEATEEPQPEEIPEETPWEEYFMVNKYYEKYLNSVGPSSFLPESDNRMLLASAYPDYSSINPFVEAEKEYSKYIVDSGDSMIADDESLMKIEAQIFNKEGDLETESTQKVKFSLSKNLASFVGSNVVLSKDGVAVVYLKAGKKVGDFRIKAEILKPDGVTVNKAYQVVEKDLHLLPGEPAKVQIASDSYVLVANNQSRTSINIILRDKFDNVASDSFNSVAVFANSVGTLDEKLDLNKDLLGVQLGTFDGKASVDLMAKDKVGEISLVVVVMDPELEEQLITSGDDWESVDFTKYIGSSQTFKVLDKVSISAQTSNENFQPISAIQADGQSIVHIGVKLMHDGISVKDYNGPIKFSILKENLGGFVNKPAEKMVNGELNPANVTFKASKLTGQEEILIDVPGFASDSVKFKTTASKAKRIELTASETSIQTGDLDKEVVLQARLLDENGNLADNDNGTIVNFKATDATKDLLTFTANNALTLNGIASVKVKGKNVSGVANILAESAGLEKGIISLKIQKHITSATAKEFAPRALYISLLGGAFGKVSDTNNLAQTLLNSDGQVEAITSITASPNEKKRLFAVDGYGKIEFLADTVKAKIMPATDSFPYQKVVLSEDMLNDELGSVFLVPKVDTPLMLIDSETDIPEKEGIFVKIIDPATKDSFKEKDDGIYLEKENNVEVKIDKFGRIFLNDDSYKLRVPTAEDLIESASFSLMLVKGPEVVALINFNQVFNQNVKELAFDSGLNNFFPGIYVQPASDKKKYQFISALSGYSTNEPNGFYLTDTENDIDSAQAPGFGYSSLEKTRDEFGLGFEGNNKHMLLFSAGNSVGQSFLPYASDSGILYGDPLIRLKIDDDLISKNTGYTKDLGKAVFSGQEPIQHMVEFDVNGDGYDDLLLVFEDGLIRLLENEISNQRFRDRGYILNIYNGIFSLTKIDVDNDGYDDLIIGTKESCNAGEQCISLLKNTNGNFDRIPLNLALNDKKVYEMKAGDMNADGCEDLVTSDSSGEISIFYNTTDGESCLGISTNYGYNKSFGYTIKEDLNQVDSLFVNYPGMEIPDDGEDTKDKKSNWYKFIEFSLPSSQPPAEVDSPAEPEMTSAKYAQDATALQNAVANSSGVATKDVPPQTFPKIMSFIHIKEDGKLTLNSAKQSKDVNGGSVAIGDEIEYLIALKNTSVTPINNLMLSDSTPTSMTLVVDSLKCMDAGCPDLTTGQAGKLEWIETGTSLRSHIIKNISIPAGGQRLIKYSMVVDMVPQVHFDLGNDFIKYPSNVNDAYLDIMVRPEVNPDGVLTYLYSTGPQSYAKMEVSPGDSSENALDKTFEKLGLPSPTDLLNTESGEVSADTQNKLKGMANKQTEDKDYNGCADSWDSLLTTSQTGGDAVASSVEALLGNLRCSGGGCAPIPYNMAFLTPGTPVAGVPGFPAVNLISNPPFIAPFGPSTIASSYFRFYLSPTLTLGLGTAVCAGTGIGGVSPCFAFAVPGGIPGVCDALESGMDEALTFSKNSLVDPAVGQVAVITDGEGVGGAKAVNTGGSFGDANDPLSANAKVNVKIPGFPSFITNWMDNQIDEIYNKLLDFPTFYFILPDFGRFGTETKLAYKNFSFKSFHDFAASVSNFPFVKLESKEIVMRIPSISKKEIEKYKYQAAAWIKHMKKELEKYNLWKCEENEDRKMLCDKILLDVQNLISSIKKMMDALDQIANLPKDILTWRNMEAKYATQIICYLDAIMNYTGGYINRQQKIIESWIKTIQDTIKTFKDWKLILDVVAEYQQSCDKCKSDRFSKLALIMQLFAAIPDPPVIPLPKWPDFVVDFSQIKTGVTIMWPDVVFRPEPIILPNLPTIVLPDLIPFDLKLDLSDWAFELNLPDFSKFTMPNLPDLPTIPLPQLPDLPKPPRIPGLPNVVGKLMANLKFIFKILCLLKSGLIPIPESTLATEIETLTQPSVQAVLPFIKSLGVQYPPIEYSYVDQIRITGKLNFDIDTNMIYLMAELGADKWNEKVKGFVKNINKFLAMPYGQWINNLLQKSVDKLYEKTGIIDDKKESSLPLSFSPSAVVNNPSVNVELFPELEKFRQEMEEVNAELNDYVAMVKAEQDATPDTYYLTATQTFLEPDDPILNRSLAEIENGISLENLPDSPGVKQLAELRDSLVAYTKGLNSSNAILENIDDMNEFTKILVDSDQSLDYLASSDTESDVSDETTNETLEFSFFGKETEDTIKEVANNADLQGERDLIASAIDFDPQDLASGDGQTTPPPVGFFVGANGVNENVLNYTKELKSETHILFNDVDHDNDYDIVFSMGGDVYLKTNHKNIPDLPKGDLILGLTNNTIPDYYNEAGTSVQGVTVPYINNGKAEISWLANTNNTKTYEVILLKSIYDNLENPAHTYKVNVDDLTDKSAPTLNIEIPNGNYYVTVFALDEDENRSMPSDVTVVAPQTCADTEPPLPVVSQTEYEVPILKDVKIDASGSFDVDGEIKQFYMESIPYETKEIDPNTKALLKITPFQKDIWSDLNVLEDDDGDGKVWNDRNNPIFNIGPFVNEGDIGKHEFILHVVDESGKDSNMKIVINVFAPEITLDETFARTALATGETKPKVGTLPFWLMRNRYISRIINGQLKLAPRIDKVKEDLTDENGTYSISDFELKDMILVENANGEIVAEINPETGDIGKLKPGYTSVVHAAVPPKSPTSVDIIDPNGLVLGTIYLLANANIDVTTHEEFGIDAENSADLAGVHADDVDIEDDFEFVKLPANDPGNPGGAILMYIPGNKPLVSIDSVGNIVILDSHIKLIQKSNDHEQDPLIVQITFDGKVIGEVLVSTLGAGIIVGPNDVPFASPHNLSEGTLKGSSGMSVPEDINFIIGPDFTFSDQDFVKRNDFVRALLRMICIVPRPEAYEPYSSGTGYSDSQVLGDYHPDIKEATLLGFVEGYKGEPDAVTGLFPFKPENTITRAEATKIILKALEFKGVVDLTVVNKEVIPWYAYYLKAGQDLTPYLKTDSFMKNNFIITPDEALDPYEIMTFGELITMIERVLDIYNCFQKDNDNDGMSDFCEAKYKIDDPQADSDSDGLNNKFECSYKLDPTDDDTDKGGVNDGKEIELKTNPLDKSDDTKDEDIDGLSGVSETMIYKTDPFNPDTDGGGKNDGQEVKDCTDPLDATDDDQGPSCNTDSEPGLYIVPAECNACPCISTFLHRADVIPGDVFFSVVGVLYQTYYQSKPKDKSYIFSKGNEVIIESVK